MCICTYPNKNPKFGEAKKGEVGFYKMGCSIWIATQKNCRVKKNLDINDSLKDFIDKKLHSNETIKIGYVGHWLNSKELISYLDFKIKPALETYQTNIEIDNTACSAMNKPLDVLGYIKSLNIGKSIYLKVKGIQTTSMGMFDNLSLRFKKADLFAIADSRKETIEYPLCSKYQNKRCTIHHKNENGFCQDEEGNLSKLKCKNIKKHKLLWKLINK